MRIRRRSLSAQLLDQAYISLIATGVADALAAHKKAFPHPKTPSQQAAEITVPESVAEVITQQQKKIVEQRIRIELLELQIGPGRTIRKN